MSAVIKTRRPKVPAATAAMQQDWLKLEAARDRVQAATTLPARFAASLHYSGECHAFIHDHHGELSTLIWGRKA